MKIFLKKIFNINPYLEIIFLIDEENQILRNYLNSLGINKIFLYGEYTIENITQEISNEKDLSMEIEKLKKIIEDNQNINVLKVPKKKIKLNKIIAISGNYGSGKSLITAMLGKATNKLNINTIIIDFDIINNSINTLFRVPKYNKKYKIINDVNQCITKINNNLDIFCGIDAFFNEENKISYEKIKRLLEDLKQRYDLILIDTSSETSLKYVRTILANVDKILFLIEPNLLEIKKAEKLLEIYIEDWEISSSKFNIILNKVNEGSVDEAILKELFNKFKIIEKISFSKQYTMLSNNIKINNWGLNKYIKILEKV